MTLTGVVLTACLVACVAAVLFAIADVARDNEQGGRTAVAMPAYAMATLPAYYPKRGRAPAYQGRHRRG